MYTVHPSGCSMFLFQDFHSSWCFPKHGMSVIQNWASNVIFLQQHALLHFRVFSAPSTCLDDAGWLSPSHSCGQLGDVERSDHHVVGAIHHHVASFQSRPMLRKIEPSPSRHGRWCHATNTCLFFKLFSFFEHGMGFTTCTPKIVLLRC